MDRMRIVLFALAGLLAGTAHGEVVQGEVVQGGLELRWGDGAPVSGARLAPKFEAALALDGGGRIVLDAEQARRGAGDLYALANRRVAVGFSRAKSGGMRAIDAIVPIDDPDDSLVHVRSGKADGVAKATLGPTRWISVACRFSDIAEEQKTVEFFRGQYGEAAGQLGHYWREVSYDRINLAGSDAVGWYALPHPRSHYVTTEGGKEKANLDALFDDCTTVADVDVDFSDVVGINMMFNGDLDGHAWGGGRCATLDGRNRCWSATWNPPWSFNNLAPLAHEMGHGYGLPHSDNSDGDDDSYDNPWDVMSDGWSNAARDSTYGTLPKHINMLQRERMGWVDAARKRTFDAGTPRTRLQLDFASLQGAGNAQMLVLQTPSSPDPYSGAFYTVEARRRIGTYESHLAGDAVIIHRVGGDYRYEAQSQDADRPPADTANNEGSMFKPGEAWVSPDGLFSLYVEAATANGFTVIVGDRGRVTGGEGARRRR
ncbi:hypothetical protein ACW5EG_02665 [Luteimonas sp. A611]